MVKGTAVGDPTGDDAPANGVVDARCRRRVGDQKVFDADDDNAPFNASLCQFGGGEEASGENGQSDSADCVDGEGSVSRRGDIGEQRGARAEPPPSSNGPIADIAFKLPPKPAAPPVVLVDARNPELLAVPAVGTL